MRRRLLTIGILLLLGAVANVAVAWGCAIYLRLHDHDGYNHLDDSHVAWWRANKPAAWNDQPAEVTFFPRFGTHSYLYIEEHWVSNQTPNNGSRRLAGFPWRSLEGSNWADHRTQTVKATGRSHTKRSDRTK